MEIVDSIAGELSHCLNKRFDSSESPNHGNLSGFYALKIIQWSAQSRQPRNVLWLKQIDFV